MKNITKSLNNNKNLKRINFIVMSLMLLLKLSYAEAASNLTKIPTTQKYWQTLYDGYGTVSYSSTTGIYLAPAASLSPEETHAALALNKSELPARFQLNVDVTNLQPLRQNSPPNSWEVFWLLFNYKGSVTDKTTNYFAFKPNGIELGAAYGSIGQDFIYTANYPQMIWGTRYTISIVRDASNITISINNVLVAQVPLTASSWLQQENGFIGLYTEDAAVQVHNVFLKALP